METDMQLNLDGTLSTTNTTSFRNNECRNNCSDCAQSDNTYANMLRVFYTVMLALVLGGPIMTSCESDEPITPDDINTQTPVQENLTDILQGLGLMTTTSTSKSVSLVKGDLMEFVFTDPQAKTISALKINEDESTDEVMVYYGIQTATYNGHQTSLRYSLSGSGAATIVKKEVKANGVYFVIGNFEFTQNADKTVAQHQIMPDGSKVLLYTYKPQSLTSLIRFNEVDGTPELLIDISIVQK